MPSSSNPLRRIYDWMLSLAQWKSATTWLALLSFAEASFSRSLRRIADSPLPWSLKAGTQVRFGLFRRFGHGRNRRLCNRGIRLGILQATFFQYVPGFTEEKFQRLTQWYAEWGWPCLSCRLFAHTVQDLHHRERGLEYASFPLHPRIRG